MEESEKCLSRGVTGSDLLFRKSSLSALERMHWREVQLELGRAVRRQSKWSSGEPMVAWLRLNGDYREKWTDSRNNEKTEPLSSSKQVTGNDALQEGRDTRHFCLMFFKYESSSQIFSQEITIAH